MKTPPLQRVCDCSRPQPKEQTDTVSTARAAERAEWGSPVAGRMGVPSGYQNGDGRKEQEVALYQAGMLLTTIFIICIGRAAGTILGLEALVT